MKGEAGQGENKRAKILNHWCHGAPGAIGPFLAGTKLLLNSGDESEIDLARRLYAAAGKAAELTWRDGLLLKGNGLCHGISGNGLLLHSMARWHTN